MQKLLSPLLVLLIMVAAVPAAPAQDSKTVAVVSLRNYDALVKNADAIGAMAGMPGVSKMLEAQIGAMTDGKGLVGIDKARPIAIAIVMKGEESFPVVCVPVTNLKGLLGILPGPLGKTEDLGDGVLGLPNSPEPVVIKESDGWALVAQEKPHLEDAPKDPLKLVGDLPKQYAIAARLMVQQVSEEVRLEMVGQMKQLAELGLQQSGGTEEELALQARMLERQMARMQRAVMETDEIILGFGVDEEQNRLFLDFSMTGVEGSAMAKDLARMQQTTSAHSGVKADVAAVSALLTVNGEPTEDEIELLEIQHKQSRDRALGHIDSDNGVPDEVKPVIKEALGQMIDIGFDTMKSGKFDAGLAFFADKKSTLVGGGYLTDGDGLEAAIKKLAKVMEDDASVPPIKWNADNHQDYRLHTVTVPLPDPEAAQFFGDQLQIAVAISPNSCYVAAGGDSIAQLKKVIDGSAADKAKKFEPLEVVIRLAPITARAATMDETGMAAQMAEVLKDKGNIRISATGIENGFRGRLELEENVIKAIGSAVPMIMMGGLGGGGGKPVAVGGDDPFGEF